MQEKFQAIRKDTCVIFSRKLRLTLEGTAAINYAWSLSDLKVMSS